MSKRKSHRNHHRPTQEVEGALVLEVEARLLDLSVNGVAVETAVPLEVGQRYRLKLEDLDHSLELAGTVAWCRPQRPPQGEDGGAPPVYQSGLELAGMLTDKARQLLALMGDNLLRPETRLSDRFAMELPAPVTLETERPFRLKEMSGSGLLVETDLAPAEGGAVRVQIHLDGGVVEAGGRVMRVRPAAASDREAQGRHEIGVELLEVPAEGRGLLAAALG